MLKLEHVTKTFNPGTVDEKVALNDVTLHIREGDFVSIIGANGAGKSTLFNAICGSFFVDKGSIFLAGRDVTMMPEHQRARQIGRLFQDPMRGSAPDMSIEENLYLAAGSGSWLTRITAADKRSFREKLSLLGMGLEDRMKQPVGLLSGGQRQALTLLMATYHVPKVLLLDEHTAALDPGTAEKVLKLTRNIVEDNHITCLMITHNMQSALALGNRTLMMDQGRVIYDVTGQERSRLTIHDLTDKFRQASGHVLDNDRMLLGVGAHPHAQSAGQTEPNEE
ncbi:MAG: ATP-binding cassette domain-containing protein [Clostridia bacterium]|nr:ATP-binding cassette domain-containing protein [Clostridia bacterium]